MKMMYTNFRRDPFFCQRNHIRKKAEFFFRGQMKNMKT